MPQVIVWPLDAMVLQRPRWSSRLPVPVLPTRRPWQNTLVLKNTPSVIHPLYMVPLLTVSGITKDSTGVILGSCVVQLFQTNNSQFIQQTTSNANGEFAFSPVNSSQTYYIVAYKQGAPSTAGTTVNTLIGQ